ncbi:MAG: hypothetical protein J5940_01975 [Clostridia bacterium]|nr:hypothetical protein [Clostridia bacterium]
MTKKSILSAVLTGLMIFALMWLYLRIRWMMLVPVVLMILLVITPLTMRRGRELIARERTSVLTQTGADIPLDYNKNRVRRGFLMMLFFLWLAPALTTLIPGGTLFIAAYIPVAFVCVFGEIAIAKAWRDFRFSVKIYWAMNISATLTLSALMFGARMLLGYS